MARRSHGPEVMGASSSGNGAPAPARMRGAFATQAELLVVLLVFGLMWTCGGLALQTRLHELRQLPARDVAEIEILYGYGAPFGADVRHVPLPRAAALLSPPPVWIEGADLGSVSLEECGR